MVIGWCLCYSIHNRRNLAQGLDCRGIRLATLVYMALVDGVTDRLFLCS